MSARIGSLLGSLVARAGGSPRLARVIDQVLEQEQARDYILHRLGTRQLHDTSLIDARLPERVVEPADFEDLHWLLSSNYANRGLASLMLEEAAWLYDTVKGLSAPRVAELGRAKGGTTFLLAAAGASVLSIENGKLETSNRRRFGGQGEGYDESLERALTRVGIASRVEVVKGDAETFTVPPDEFDLVFVDVVLPVEREKRMFDRWWAGVKPGGRLVLRDGREPRTPSVVKLTRELEGRRDIQFELPAPGVFSVLVNTRGGVAPPPPTPSIPVG